MRLERVLSNGGFCVAVASCVTTEIHILQCWLDGTFPDRALCGALAVWTTAGFAAMKLAHKMRVKRLQARLDALLFNAESGVEASCE